MDDRQRYLFDTRGVFTVPAALSPAQLLELNAIFDRVEDDPSRETGGAGKVGGDALHWGQAYRELLDHPRISPVLEELVGNHRGHEGNRVEAAAAKVQMASIPTFRIDHINVHNRCKANAGFMGHNLHGGGQGASGNHGGGGSQFFHYQDGHFFNGLTVVAYELRDTHSNGGGFCCVPGSHQGHIRIPEEMGDMSLTENTTADWLQRFPAYAGDAIM